MASPKLNKHYMTSPPIANSARFRSPGIQRRIIQGDPGYQSAQFAKKSRRSKSSEANSRNVASNLLSGKRKLSKQDEGTVEQHLEILNNRWKMMAKNQEKMTKDEIMKNYKLLLTDHIKLEKFMSLISRENELNRTRLESDLLDSMMIVEELKQALSARDLHRRSRIDPRESEERRELIKQNKKLLHELHESAKKVEKLELSVFELQEQVELKDFQMMEVQNQKIIIEEQLEGRIEAQSMGTETGANLMSEVKRLKEELDNVQSDYEAMQTEYSLIVPELESIKSENEVLKISEENLNEELSVKVTEIESLKRDVELLENRLKNPDETPGSVGRQKYVKGPTSQEEDDNKTIVSCSDDNLFDESMCSIATDSGFELSDGLLMASSNSAGGGGDADGGNTNHHRNAVANGDEKLMLLQDTVRMLVGMLREKECSESSAAGIKSHLGVDKLQNASVCGHYHRRNKSLFEELKEADLFVNDSCNSANQKITDASERHSPIGACCSSAYKLHTVEMENRRWKAFVGNIGKSENELLHVIADLEENIRNAKQELEGLKHRDGVSNNYSPTKGSSTANDNKDDEAHRSADYFSKQLKEIQTDQSEEEVNFLLDQAESAKHDAIQKAIRLEEELDSCNRYIEKLDGELTSEKKIELTLRKRIDTLEQRLLSVTSGTSGNAAAVHQKLLSEMEMKISQLESINSSLIEVNGVEKRRMEEHKAKLKELELANKNLNEKFNVLQMKEISSQKKNSRLQSIYEDLLREYALLKTPDLNVKNKSTTSENVIQENMKLKLKLHDQFEKIDNLKTLVIRYQELLFGQSKMSNLNGNKHNQYSNKSLQSHFKDFEEKMGHLSRK